MATAEEAPVGAAAEKQVDSKTSEVDTVKKSDETEDQVKDTKGSDAQGPTGADEDDYERYDDDDRDKRDRPDRDNKSRDKGDRRDDRGGRRDNKRGEGRRGGKFGGSRGGFKGDKRNVKTRFDNRPESDDADSIRRQVEFYFSDSNLPIDQFLLSQVGGVENKPVPLKVIHNFSRMRNFQPFSAVVAAVKESGFLAVNDQDEVYRKTPIADHFTMDVKENESALTTDSMKRSIYAKGFGPEGEKTAFDIEAFFEPYGVKGVRLRRDHTRRFKESVFVEFVDEASAEQFLQLDPKPKFNDNELLVKSKKAYVDEKVAGIKDGSVRPRSPTGRGGRGGGGRGDRGKFQRRGGGGFRGSDDRKRRHGVDDEDDDDEDWRARRDRFQKEKRRKGNDGEAKEGDKDDAAKEGADKASKGEGAARREGKESGAEKSEGAAVAGADA